jgi:transcriptional regulator with XRE-family HTH domain
MSQEAVAARIGVDYRLFQRWEYGQRAPSLFLLVAWCQALGCALVVAVPSPPGLADRPAPSRGGSKTAASSHPGFVPEISPERLAG